MKLPQRFFTLLVWFVFLVTRLLIWTNPPQEFTQIIYAYMPYAHLWASGELPYLNQWYEYPPLTIPFFYLPHIVDMATNNHWYHINYSDAYKTILTLADVAVFLMVWKVLKKFKIKKINIALSLVYYSLITLKAHNFIYDSYDLLFMVGMMLAVVGPILWKKSGQFWGWLGYMSAVALKLVNAPLGLVQAVLEKQNIKKLVFTIVIAGLLVWAIPLLYFRSSLLVIGEYHKIRGLQIESFPATIVRTINQWTETEHVVEVAKAYDIAGPVSLRVKNIFDVLFPVSLLLYIMFSTHISWKSNKKYYAEIGIWITLGYICLFMITATVLSTPYLLWHIPFAAMLPTKKLSQKLKILIVSAIVIVAGMTYFPNVPMGPLTSHIWLGWIKTIGFSMIFVLVLRQLLNYKHRRLAK